MPGDFTKDITGMVTLLIGVALIALLVGHAAGTGSLIQASATGLNTLLNTVELTTTASNTPYTPSSNGAFGDLSTIDSGSFDTGGQTIGTVD